MTSEKNAEKTVAQWQTQLRQGGALKYHEKLAKQKKAFVRDRIEWLTDPGSFVEDGLYANCTSEGLAADGVVTGLATIEGRTVALMGNDFTVKAGSWGKRTVEKILRIQETAQKLEVPVYYLVDSAGARITDQIEMFAGRRGAGKIFYHESNYSGQAPQICVLFGPSAAGGAYIPSFCDVLIMVEGNASMYLGSPRMAEAVIGEKVTLDEMGGARMHCTVSGVGDILVPDEKTAIEKARQYLSYFPQNYRSQPPEADARPVDKAAKPLKQCLPENPARAYDMKDVIESLVDEKSFFEIKELYAKEVITGYAHIEGKVVGIVANQPKVKAGVLFVESSNKAARFIQICDAYNIPLLFLSDVPGFMIGSKVERDGMIRAGAKMVYSVSRAQVPKICLVVRKAYGAGLYAMSGPAFGSDAVLALPSGEVAIMGPEPAVNAVYYNKIAEMDPAQKKAFIDEKIKEYKKEIDLYRMGAEMVVDHIVDFDDARTEIARRFEHYRTTGPRPSRRPGVMPM